MNIQQPQILRVSLIADRFADSMYRFNKKVQSYIIKQKVKETFIPKIFQSQSLLMFNQIVLLIAQIDKNLISLQGFQKLVQLFDNLNRSKLKIFTFCMQKFNEQFNKLALQINKRQQIKNKDQFCTKCNQNIHKMHIEGQRNQILNLRITDPYYYYNEVIVETNSEMLKEEASHKVMQSKLSELLYSFDMEQKFIMELIEEFQNHHKNINLIPQIVTQNENIHMPVVPFIKSIYKFMKNRSQGFQKSTQTDPNDNYQYKQRNDQEKTKTNEYIFKGNPLQIYKNHNQKNQKRFDERQYIKRLQDKNKDLQKKFGCLKIQFKELDEQYKSLLDKYSFLLIQNKKISHSNGRSSSKLKAMNSKGHKARGSDNSMDQLLLNDKRQNSKMEPWNSPNLYQGQNYDNKMPNIQKKVKKNSSFALQKSSFLSRNSENKSHLKKQSFKLDVDNYILPKSNQSIERSSKTISQQVFKQLLNIPQQIRQFQKSEAQILLNDSSVKKHTKKNYKTSMRFDKSLDQIRNQRSSMQNKFIKRSFKIQAESNHFNPPKIKISQSQNKREVQSKQQLLRKLYANEINQNHLSQVDYQKFKQSYFNKFIKVLQQRKDAVFNQNAAKTFVKKKNNYQIKASIIRKQTLPPRLTNDSAAIQSKSPEQTQNEIKYLQQIQSNLMTSFFQEQRQMFNKSKERRQSIILHKFQINLITQIFAYLVQLKLNKINAYIKVKKMLNIFQGKALIQKKNEGHLNENLFIKQNLSFLIKLHRKCKQNDKQAQPCHHIKILITNIVALLQN